MKPFEVTQRIDVFLSDEQQKQIALDYLYNKFEWRDNYRIQNGKVVKTQIYHTSHSWASEEAVRDANEIDYAIETVVKRIRFK